MDVNLRLFHSVGLTLMKFNMKTTITILLVSMFLSLLSRAQEDKKKIKVNITVACVKLVNDLDTLMVYKSEDDFDSIEFYPDSFSSTLKYKGPRVMKLAFGGGTPFNFTAPANVKDLLLLLVPTRQEGVLSYKVLSFDNSARGFPYGTRRMFNLTNTKLKLSVGQKNLIISPNKHKDLVIKKGNNGNRSFHIAFSINLKEGWKRISETKWLINKKKRNFIFFYRRPNTNRYTYHAIADYKTS